MAEKFIKIRRNRPPVEEVNGNVKPKVEEKEEVNGNVKPKVEEKEEVNGNVKPVLQKKSVRKKPVLQETPVKKKKKKKKKKIRNIEQVNLEKCSVVVDAIKKSEFTTHDFIKKYGSTEFFEKDYVEILWDRRRSDKVFKVAHGKIGRFLKYNQEDLGIEHIGRSMSTDMFGTRREVARWRKVAKKDKK